MGNPFNPYDCYTVNYSYSGYNNNNVGSTITGYDVSTHRSTTE